MQFIFYNNFPAYTIYIYKNILFYRFLITSETIKVEILLIFV